MAEEIIDWTEVGTVQGEPRTEDLILLTQSRREENSKIFTKALCTHSIDPFRATAAPSVYLL